MNATNQQLAFAKVQARAAMSVGSTFMRRAHWQAGVMQLNMALECYAAELLEVTKIQVPVRPGRGMFEALLRDVAAIGKASRELEELAQLERDPESWLCRVQRWSETPLTLGAETGRASVLAETSLTELAKPVGPMIEVVHVDHDFPSSPPFDERQFDEALAQAYQLVERQRQSSSEY